MNAVLTGAHINTVLALLNAKAFVNVCDQEGRTALEMVIDYDWGEIALIDKEEDIDYTGEMSPLIIKALVLAGADPFMVNNKGETAWHKATMGVRGVMKSARRRRLYNKFAYEVVTQRGLAVHNSSLVLPEDAMYLIGCFLNQSLVDILNEERAWGALSDGETESPEESVSERDWLEFFEG